jgi:hypothetical protein
MYVVVCCILDYAVCLLALFLHSTPLCSVSLHSADLYLRLFHDYLNTTYSRKIGLRLSLS